MRHPDFIEGKIDTSSSNASRSSSKTRRMKIDVYFTHSA